MDDAKPAPIDTYTPIPEPPPFASLIDYVKHETGAASDRELDRMLGARGQIVAQWRTRGVLPSDKNLIKLCRLAKLDDDTITYYLMMTRAADAAIKGDDDTAGYYTYVLRRLGVDVPSIVSDRIRRLAKAAATLALPALVYFSHIPSAFADVAGKPVTSANVYYVLFRRWIISRFKVAPSGAVPRPGWDGKLHPGFFTQTFVSNLTNRSAAYA